MTIFKWILTSILFGFILVISDAQVVQGVLVDQVSEKPLAFALVFIENTTIGTTTNELGQFSLAYGDRQQDANVVFTHLGYDAKKIPVRDIGSNFLDTISMTEEEYNLAEAVVVAGDQWRLRQQRVKRFLALMTGNSSGAYVSIKNTDALFFREQDGILSATALTPLQIINRDLGYEILFFMEHFQANEKDDVQFRGSLHFKELRKSGEPTQAQVRNRIKAYQSLPEYFFQYLANPKGLREFPWDMLLADRKNREFVEHRQVEEFELPIVQRTDGLYLLMLDRYLMICSPTKKKETPIPNSAVRTFSGQIIFDSNGKVQNPREIEYTGRWGMQRAGHFLPEDYQPPERKKKRRDP